MCVDGSTPEIYGIYRDITERKHAEEALKRSEAYLSEGQRLSHTGSWARNVSTGEVYFSQESFRIFGLDPATTKVTIETVLSRMHPDDRPSFAETIQKAFHDASDYEGDYRIVLENGTIRHIHLIGHPVKNAAGNVIEFIGTHMDVTEQHLSRKALQDALVEINTLKEQLLQENVALRQEIDETSMFEEIRREEQLIAKGVEGARDGWTDRFYCPHLWGNRHRQGTDRTCDSQSEFQAIERLRQGELCRDSYRFT